MTAVLPARPGVASGTGTAPALAAPWLGIAVPVAIGLLGFVLRLLVMLRGGGLTGFGAYDDGVYYAAADALVHGRLPYRDFLFIQPPGIVVAAAPFAALGSVLGDQVGIAVGRLAFEAVGGLNAVLVFLNLRRFGRPAAIVGGVLYAVLLPAVYAERSILLEPIGTLGILAALLLLTRDDRRGFALAAGAAAAVAVDLKIWYIVPAVLIGVLGTRRVLRYALGFGAGLVACYGPFFLAAPGASWREIVLDQLGRPRIPGVWHRFEGILAAHAIGPLTLRESTVVLLLLALAALVVAARTPGARLYAVLLVADGLVLLASPSWFIHYAVLTAPPLALCVGVAAGALARRLPQRAWVRIAATVAVVALLVGAGAREDQRLKSGVPTPAALVVAMQHVRGCITSDDPTLLAVTGVLSRDLGEAGCPVWPDVTGWTYDSPLDRTTTGAFIPRPEDDHWQRLVLAYLESGRATITVRTDTGLSTATRDELAERAPLFTDGRYVLRPTHQG